MERYEATCQVERYEADEARVLAQRPRGVRTAAWHAGGGCLLMGDRVTDDTLLGILRFLPAKALLRVLLTCKRFNIKCIAAPRGIATGGAAAAAAAPEMLCIVEEAGRLWVAGHSEQERGWVPRGELESWLGVMHEVAVLQMPLVFGRAHADLTLSEGPGRWRRGTRRTATGGPRLPRWRFGRGATSRSSRWSKVTTSASV